jgi:hypothetical protein|tara:strand:- start:438 stop:1643 length:1206 start_codon:yes stop_codon:yes gene_type:complete
MATTKVSGELVDLNESTSESGLKIPTGTNANRPATDVAGMIRNNTNESSNSSASCEEYYNGTAWKKINNVAIPPPLLFKTLIYSGNGSTQSLTGLGFQPDFVWIKNRNGTNPHGLWDSTRGAGKLIKSSSTDIQTGNSGDLLGSFDSDGFQVNRNYLSFTAYDNTNWGAGTYVAWCWKANGGTTSSNSNGSITSTVQAFSDAGFSIVKYTGTLAAATVGHGLSSAPEMVIVKNLNSSTNWWVWSANLGGGDKYLKLNGSDAVATATSIWDGTVPTSTVFSVANDSGSNGSGNEIIAYCFHSVANVSKISSYTGNGASTQAITGVGFQPDFIMLKDINSTEQWYMFDSVRGSDKYLHPNLDSSEGTSTDRLKTFDSDGFTVGSDAAVNGNGNTFIYIAIKTN